MGIDPEASTAIEVDVHPRILSRWQYYLRKGVPEEEIKELLKKYKVPKEWSAPALNNVVKKAITSNQRIGDQYRKDIQDIAGVALTALSSVIQMLNDPDELPDKDLFLERLFDGAKLLAELSNRQSESRRACILPSLSQDSKDSLQESKPDDLLFGSNFNDKMKEAQITNELAKQLRHAPLRSNNSKFNLNSRGPGGNRPPSRSQEGQKKKSVLFKPKPAIRKQSQHKSSSSGNYKSGRDSYNKSHRSKK